MLLRTRITLLFTTVSGILLILFSLTIYYLTSWYRIIEFEERLQKKIVATSRLFADIDEVDARLLRIIQQQELGVLPNEQIKVFSLNGEELYRSDEIKYFQVPKDFLEDVKNGEANYLQIENFEVFASVYKGKSGTFIVVAGGFDKFGFSKLRNLRNTLFIVTLIGIFLFSIISWIFSGRALLPISRVISQAEGITPDNLSIRLDEGNGQDELARMAKAFNQLLERIEIAFNAQKIFVASASHELRTPLTMIQGQLEVLVMKDRNQDEYKNVVQSTLEDIKRLSNISNQLLLLSQMERNINEIKILELRIDELIWEVRNELLKVYPYYSVSVNFLSTPEDEVNLVIEGNAQLISTAFHNLIENACKFSDDNQCNVEIGFNENEIIFRCSDQGIGIDSKELELLFQPFYRSSAARQFQGHGLGLSMVDRIVRLHKGNISVNSSSLTGTTFQLLLPKKFYKL